MEYVYAADFGSRVKIGYSTNVPKRIKQIGNAQGQKSKDLFYIQADRDIESAIHEIFRAERISSEWYAIPFDRAKRTLADASQNPGKYKGAYKKKVSEAQKKASIKYLREKTDSIQIRAQKGTKERWKDAAAHGKSLNQFIVDTVESEIDQTKGGEQDGD